MCGNLLKPFSEIMKIREEITEPSILPAVITDILWKLLFSITKAKFIYLKFIKHFFLSLFITENWTFFPIIARSVHTITFAHKKFGLLLWLLIFNFRWLVFFSSFFLCIKNSWQSYPLFPFVVVVPLLSLRNNRITCLKN